VFKKTYFLTAVAVVAFVTTSNLQAQKPLAFQGAKIITMAGDTIENGTVVFRDGKISDVGADIKVPVEARVIDASDKVIMPGFVEAHTSSGMSQANETNPVVPYVSVIDSIDPMNSYFRSARRNGVTTVRVAPGNSTLIGGQAAVIKTGGEFIDDMVLKSDAGVKISLRPVSGSRMGHLAKLRKALDEAKRKLDKKKKAEKKAEKKKEEEAKKKEEKKGEADKKEGAAKKKRTRKNRVVKKKEADEKEDKEKDGDKKEVDKDEEEKKDKDKKDDKKEEEGKDKKESESKKSDKKDDDKKPEEVESELDKAMFAILSGELPVMIYCDKAMDVGQAMRLIKQYNFKASLVLGKECYKAAEQIADANLPVMIDPQLVFFEEDPRTKEETKIVLPKVFRDHEVKFAFQVGRGGGTTLGNTYFWYQAATAVKYGMPVEEALEALTTLPAKFLGVDEFVGSIEEGKDADIIVLSGEPLRVDTWVEMTVVNGEIVYEKDKDEQLKLLLQGETE
jgi:imidazolonepropionase-like amidohydrolase